MGPAFPRRSVLGSSALAFLILAPQPTALATRPSPIQAAGGTPQASNPAGETPGIPGSRLWRARYEPGDAVSLGVSPNGTKVFWSAMLELKGGKIVRQTVVQAWDG